MTKTDFTGVQRHPDISQYDLHVLWDKARSMRGVDDVEVSGKTSNGLEHWTAECHIEQTARGGPHGHFLITAATPAEALNELILAVELYVAQRRMFKSTPTQTAQVPTQLDLFP
jgi:hypothetical protein